MSEAAFGVRALGEVVLRTGRLDEMRAFYRDIIGLEVMRVFEDGMTFFRLAPGFEGHTAVLALFPLDRGEGWQGHEQSRSTLHHFARASPMPSMPPRWPRSPPGASNRGPRMGRLAFVHDPDGNTVELQRPGAGMTLGEVVLRTVDRLDRDAAFFRDISRHANGYEFRHQQPHLAPVDGEPSSAWRPASKATRLVLALFPLDRGALRGLAGPRAAGKATSDTSIL